ncbi:MAG: AAA family ATPase [Magnetococcales bacterium]|nr:AAA family ATPase [Magnetococcales bacterium]
MALKILVAYARGDEVYQQELLGSLSVLKTQEEGALWEERLLDVGGNWRARIQDTLEISSSICLMVSPAFLASGFLQSFEWKRCLERVRRGEVFAAVIRVRPSDVSPEVLSDCSVFPKDGAANDLFYGTSGLFMNVANQLVNHVKQKAETHPSTRWKHKPIQLKRVGLTNFRCYKRLEIELDPFLNVLVGNNGAGKSALLDAIAIALDAIVVFFLDTAPQQLKKQDILLDSNGEPAPFAIIEAMTFYGLFWSRYEKWGPSRVTNDENYGVSRLSELHDALNDYREQVEFPVIVYYGIRRGHPGNESDTTEQMGARFEALRGACHGVTDFKRVLQWFHFYEGQELRQQRKLQDFNYRLRWLDVVRRAIGKMIPEVANPRTEDKPDELLVDWNADGVSKTLSFAQLSDGYRSMLALVMDLARRMVQANPHLPEPLDGHAVVLIDEIDLHLHPKWQQTVLGDLRRTFPQTQFIVTTHSPQVLTTVEPHQIQCIHWSGDQVELLHPNSSFGAESGRLLQDIQGVEPRPPKVEFTQLLNRYSDLIADGQGRESEAVEIRKKLDVWANGDEPELVRADMEMRRQELFGR